MNDCAQASLSFEGKLRVIANEKVELRQELDAANSEMKTLQQGILESQTRLAEAEVQRNKALDGVKIRSSADNATLERLHTRVGELEEALRCADSIRRQLHNSLQDLKGNVRVIARIRPCPKGSTGAVTVDADRSAVVVRAPARTKVDGSLQPSSPQRFSNGPASMQLLLTSR